MILVSFVITLIGAKHETIHKYSFINRCPLGAGVGVHNVPPILAHAAIIKSSQTINKTCLSLSEDTLIKLHEAKDETEGFDYA